MKLSTYTSPVNVASKHTGVISAYRFVVSTAYKHDSLGFNTFKFGGKNASDLYIAGAPAVEYVSTFRVLANMYYADKSSARVARRSLKQLGWVYNSVSLVNKPRMFDTVGLSYRSIFGFARRIFLMSSKFKYIRRSPAMLANVAENKLFASPLMQYRRIRHTSTARATKKQIRNYIFTARLWRAIHKIRRIVTRQGREAWWKGPWTNTFKTKLKPTKQSVGMSLIFRRGWFNIQFMRAFYPRGRKCFTKWDHVPLADRGRYSIITRYLDKRTRVRRFPRNWRKTRRYVRLKSERTTWIYNAATYNYRSSRNFVALNSGATFDGSYSQLTLVGGSRTILRVPDRLAIRKLFNTTVALRKFRRVVCRGFRRAVRFRRKYDRTSPFLPKVPRNPTTGAFSISPRLGYSRLNRFVSSVRADFRAAKIFKTRNAGEWFYRIGSVSRTLFYKRLSSWSSGSSSNTAILKLRRYCGIDSDSWTGIALGYFKSQVGNPALKSKNHYLVYKAIYGVMGLNPTGFFIERNMTRWSNYDLAFFSPRIDVSYIRNQYLEWATEQKVERIRQLVPGQNFPNLGEEYNATVLSDRSNRKLLGRKLGFVDKFLAYSILNIKSSTNTKALAGTPYRRVLERAVTRMPTHIGAVYCGSLAARQDSAEIASMARQRELDWAAFNRAESHDFSSEKCAHTLTEQAYPGTLIMDDSGSKHTPTHSSKWVKTAFGLRRVAAVACGRKTYFVVANPLQVATRTAPEFMQGSVKRTSKTPVNKKSHSKVYSLRFPVLFGSASQVFSGNNSKHTSSETTPTFSVTVSPTRGGLSMSKRVIRTDISNFKLRREASLKLRVTASFVNQSGDTLPSKVQIRFRKRSSRNAEVFNKLAGLNFVAKYQLVDEARRKALGICKEPITTYMYGANSTNRSCIFRGRANREAHFHGFAGFGRQYLSSYYARVSELKLLKKKVPADFQQEFDAVLALVKTEQERRQTRKLRRRDFFKNQQKNTPVTKRSQEWRKNQQKMVAKTRPNASTKRGAGNKQNQNPRVFNKSTKK